MGLDCLFDGDKLVHQSLVNLQTACRIDNEYVIAFPLRFVHSRKGDLFRFFAVPHSEDWRIHGLSYDFQLIDGCRPINVAGAQHRFFAVFLKVGRQFSAGGRLTGTLQSHHKQYRKSAGRISQFTARAAHQFGQLPVYNFDHLLGRSQTFHDFFAQGFFFHGLDKFFHHFKVYIRFQQREFDLAHGVFFTQRAFAFQVFKDALKLF